jgi:hypothetical protein
MKVTYENQIMVSNAICGATNRQVYFDDSSLVDAKTGTTVLFDAIGKGFSVDELIEIVQNRFVELTKYTVDDLFFSVTEIYTSLDEGEIEYKDAREMLVRCCEAYITKDPNR